MSNKSHSKENNFTIYMLNLFCWNRIHMWIIFDMVYAILVELHWGNMMHVRSLILDDISIAVHIFFGLCRLFPYITTPAIVSFSHRGMDYLLAWHLHTYKWEIEIIQRGMISWRIHRWQIAPCQDPRTVFRFWLHPGLLFICYPWLSAAVSYYSAFIWTHPDGNSWTRFLSLLLFCFFKPRLCN